MWAKVTERGYFRESSFRQYQSGLHKCEKSMEDDTGLHFSKDI